MSEITVQRVDVRGQEIAYRRSGSGPALVVFPSLGFSGQWWPLYDELASSYDVIVPDLPGFGDSPQIEWARTLDDLVIFLAEFLDLVGAPEFHLVGHSFGGWVAAEFASVYPSRVTSLVLVTPMGVRVQGEPVADLFRMTPERRLDIQLNGDTSALPQPDGDEDRVDAILRDYHDLSGFGRFAWNPRYDIQLDRRLGRVTKKSLVVSVDEDRTVPASHAARFAELLPNSRQVTVHGTDAPSAHGVVVQEPEALAREIISFIGETDA